MLNEISCVCPNLEALKSKGYQNLFGLDIEENMCKIAFEKTKLPIEVGSHSNIPYKDNFFDAVILIAMIHFVDDLDVLFDGLRRICKKDALIFIATQSYKQIESRFYNKYFPSIVEIDKKHYHKIETIISTAKQNGFSLCAEEDFLSGTEMIVDEKYFKLVKDKGFFIFERLAQLQNDEFNKGVSQLEEYMKNNGNFIAPFAGWTIITLQNRKEN